MLLVPNNYGIKESREALQLGLSLLLAGTQFAKKNKFAGYATLTKAAGQLFPAIENSKEIIPEMKNLDGAEIDILILDVKTVLPEIANAKALELANIAITIVVSVAKGISEYKKAQTPAK